MKKKIYFLWFLTTFLIFLSSISAFGQPRLKWDKPWGTAEYDYFIAPNGGKIYCRIVDNMAMEISIGPYVKGCRSGDRGHVEYAWGSKRIQGVKGIISLPSKVEVRHCNEYRDFDTYYGVYSIVGIDGDAFKNCKELISITLPNSIRYIRNNAFPGCDNLTTINIPSTMKDIGLDFAKGCSKLTAVNVDVETGTNYHSFDGILCKNGMTVFCPKAYLGSVRVPSNIKGIGKETFKDCQQLTEVIIEDGVQNIDESAFQGCTLMTRIVIPNTVKEIGQNSFEGCSLLSEVELGEGVSQIGKCAFADCMNLKEILLPNGLHELAAEAFKGCISLERINLPEGIKVIRSETFSFCTALREIRLPTSVEDIFERAFMGCSSLEKVVLGPRVKNIGKYAFFSCTNLTSINVPKQAKVYDETFMECFKLRH